MAGILRIPAQLPKTTQDWEQFVRVLNENFQYRDGRVIMEALTTISTRTGTDVDTLMSYLTDAGKAVDQRFLPQVSAGNVLSLQNINPLTAEADATTASITIAAHTVQYGFGVVSYSGGAISGLTPETDYYVYCDDPNYAGGAVSYFATTTRQNVTASNGRYFVGAIRTAIAATVATITAATSASPIAFTTSAAHGWSTGNSVTFAALPGDFGTNLNATTQTITVTGATTFTVAVNGSGYAAYTTGGTATRVTTPTDGAAGGGGGWVDTFCFGGF